MLFFFLRGGWVLVLEGGAGAGVGRKTSLSCHGCLIVVDVFNLYQLLGYIENCHFPTLH